MYTFLDKHCFVPYYGLTAEEVKILLEKTYKLDAQIYVSSVNYHLLNNRYLIFGNSIRHKQCLDVATHLKNSG